MNFGELDPVCFPPPTSCVEIMGCWYKGDIHPGRIDGSRGSVAWGEIVDGMVCVCLVDLDGIDGAGNMGSRFSRITDRSSLFIVLLGLSKLCGFDVLEALAKVQGIDPAEATNRAEVYRWAGLPPPVQIVTHHPNNKKLDQPAKANDGRDATGCYRDD